MEIDTNQAKRLLERVTEFPDLPHNLLSTATNHDRRARTRRSPPNLAHVIQPEVP